ncbi:5-(carboxyamino)imidazole ribonucleotide synthase [Aerococcus sp. HMSC035B07]|nr:5-(carboxyamino)imidazole ribonucleotide synthase [Aerococcus sanguinicola]OHO43983.1 5-(carboxyamino)imidazole ribonucleotide synthase [Aerococcus sp. HMSC035B07]
MTNLTRTILPGQTIGIIGGGQLGQMLAQAAKEMGFRVGILDPGANCSAAQVSDFHYQRAYDDREALVAFADACDVLTFEFENIDTDSLQALGDRVYLPQGTELLAKTQDRLTEKAFLQAAGAQVAPYCRVASPADLQAGLDQLGYPAVLKTTRFGYDGKGQQVLRSARDINQAAELIKDQVCILEAWVPFSKELSVMAVGKPGGDLVTFPVAENIHSDNILFESIVPARISAELQAKADQVARQIARAGHLVGTLGIEMFLTAEGNILINELAPRPHNSGHYTIESCDFSQFDLHIRAICNWDLPKPRLLKPALMVNVLGQDLDPFKDHLAQASHWHPHLYGKDQAKVNRKMGHLTLLTDDMTQSLEEIKATEIWKRG